jgi:hypothetical protein
MVPINFFFESKKNFQKKTKKNMFVEWDQRHPFVVYIRFPDKVLDEADLELYLTEFHNIYELKKPFVLVIDTVLLKEPKWSFFKRQIDFLKDHKPLSKELMKGVSVVIEKPFVRGLLKTLLTLYTPVVKPVVHDNFEQACQWAIQSFASTLDSSSAAETPLEAEPLWRMTVHEYIGHALFDCSEANEHICTRAQNLLKTPMMQNAYQLAFLNHEVQAFCTSFQATHPDFVRETLLFYEALKLVYQVLSEPMYDEYFPGVSRDHAAVLVTEYIYRADCGTTGNIFMTQLQNVQ